MVTPRSVRIGRRKRRSVPLPATGTKPVQACTNMQVAPQNSSLVIDAGAIVTKAGFAGKSGPSIVFPSFVGRLRVGQGNHFPDVKQFYVGDDACSKLGALILRRPIEVRNNINSSKNNNQ